MNFYPSFKLIIPFSPLILLCLSLINCTQKKPVITIVDIGKSSRLGIGRELRFVKKFSPKIIGLDFFLVYDSLAMDSILVKELNKSDNIVMIAGLHDYKDATGVWDSLEVSNKKFKRKEEGFGSLIKYDSVFSLTLSPNQLFRQELIPAFSYVIAKKSYGIKEKYRDKGLLNELDVDISDIGTNYRVIKNSDLMSGRVNEEDLRGKIVLMGYVGIKEDAFYVDDSKSRKMNGVEIHAELINELIDR